jgi:hypothetical protein
MTPPTTGRSESCGIVRCEPSKHPLPASGGRCDRIVDTLEKEFTMLKRFGTARSTLTHRKKLTHRIHAMLATVLFAVLSLGGMAASAPAQAASARPSAGIGQEVLQNVYTSRCLDDSRFGLRSIPCNGLVYQNWTEHVVSFLPYTFTLQSHSTGRCLDDSRFGLRTIACNGLPYQQFRQIDTVWYRFYMVNVATGQCVDDSPIKLRSFPCNWLSYQQWRVPFSF